MSGPRTALAGETAAVERGGLNLYKFGEPQTLSPTGWRVGDYMYTDPLWSKETPALNLARNADAIWSEMQQGRPIFDSYRNPVTGLQIRTGGTLGWERSFIESGGFNPAKPWIYDATMGAYRPAP